VVSGERDRGGVQLEPSALRRTQRPHPVRAGGRWDTAERFEHADQSFEGVVLVLGGGEPPHPLSWPTRDRPEAAQRMFPAPPTGDVIEVAEVELIFLAGVSVNRHRHCGGRSEPWTPNVADGTHRRIRTVKALGAQLVMHRHGQQARVGAQQRPDPGPPRHGQHPPLVRHLHSDRWTLLEPLADRGQMKPGHLGDLDGGPALELERVYVHVLLLVHHEPGGPFSCRAWSLDTLAGPPHPLVDG
jgi:hypothetical protein